MSAAFRFGFLVFGLNWAVFLAFMPLVFSGFIADAFLWIIIDTALVTISSYLVLIYLIADSTGASVLVEYWDGKLQLVVPDTNYQIASNFIAYDGMDIGKRFTEFERYNAVKASVDEKQGILSEDDAITLLSDIGIRDGSQAGYERL